MLNLPIVKDWTLALGNKELSTQSLVNDAVTSLRRMLKGTTPEQAADEWQTIKERVEMYVQEEMIVGPPEIEELYLSLRDLEEAILFYDPGTKPEQYGHSLAVAALAYLISAESEKQKYFAHFTHSYVEELLYGIQLHASAKQQLAVGEKFRAVNQAIKAKAQKAAAGKHAAFEKRRSLLIARYEEMKQMNASITMKKAAEELHQVHGINVSFDTAYEWIRLHVKNKSAPAVVDPLTPDPLPKKKT